MKKVGVFVDVSNLYYTIMSKFNDRLNYSKYLDIAIGKDTLYRAYAYGAQMGTEAQGFIDTLKTLGYIPKYKKPKEYDNPDFRINIEVIEELIKDQVGKYHPDHHQEMMDSFEAIRKVIRGKQSIRKADWDVGIAMDIVRIADRLDVVVIGTADGDLAPVVRWAQDKGCECMIFACTISRELRETADKVIEIDESLLGVEHEHKQLAE